MEKGKKICNTLKEIRLQVARENDIPYEPKECSHEGDCAGTCPRCEQEVRYIEHQLNIRRMLGKVVKAAGVSAGLVTLTAFGCNSQSCSAGNSNSSAMKCDSDKVYQVFGDVAEILPSFPGGAPELKKFLVENTNYTEEMAKEGLQGRVVVNFVIAEDGSITNPTIFKSVHPLLDEEALRVISIMPKWEPAILYGDPQRVKYNLPITFRQNQ